MSLPPAEVRPPRGFRVPISWKLLGATAVVGAVAAAIAVVGLKRIETIKEDLTHTVDFLSTNVKLATLVKQDLITATRAERNMLLAQSEDGKQQFAGVIDEVLAMMDERLKQFQEVILPEDRADLSLFQKTWAQWRENNLNVRACMSVATDIEARHISVGDAQNALDRLAQVRQDIRRQARRDASHARDIEDFAAFEAANDRLLLADDIYQSALELHRVEKDLILATKNEEVQKYEDLSKSLAEQLSEQVQLMSEVVGDDSDSTLADLRNVYRQFVDANSRVRSAAGDKSHMLAYTLAYEVGAPIAADCERILNALVAKKELRMRQYRRAGEETYQNSRRTLLGISIVGILCSVAISFYAGQRIARRLSALAHYSSHIQSTGDLSLPTPDLGYDEVGQLAVAFDRMRQSLYSNTLSLQEQTARLEELAESLQAKNREVEQFVYTVSHDLKSPLVSCKGLLGLLREDVADEDYDGINDSVSRLEDATEQLNEIIDDLLTLSRIGKTGRKPTEIDVNELLEELADEFTERIAAAKATVNIQPQLPTAVADRSDVRRIFENLIVNALKYGCRTPHASISIGGDQEGSEVRYFVHDEGPGIDPKYHQRVFGLFQRLETDQPGTGLGLASVAKTMSLYGGRAWVESDVGRGATFWIAFPRNPRPPRN